MRYLAIDPGKKNNGWASFGPDGKSLDMGVYSDQDKFLDWLEDIPETELTVVIERYRNRVDRGNINKAAWSENETSQVIGAIRRICRKRGWDVVLQDPSPGLSVGLRFLGVYTTYYRGKKCIKHVPDNISALAHGTYYLRREGIQKP